MNFDHERDRLSRIKPYLQLRALVFQLTRSFFVQRGFLEIDTPVRVPVVAPEEHITPFQSEGWFLSTSPELHMKRLLASGYERIFQITRCFRKGERGSQHNPEFTMLEWYRVGADYRRLIVDTEELVSFIAGQLVSGPAMAAERGRDIDLHLPWPRFSVRKAFLDAAGWDPIAANDPALFDTDLVTKVIPSFDPSRPVVLEGYPASMASLARLNPKDRSAAERAEVFIGGLELANAYSELADAKEQRIRFEEEAERIRAAAGHATLPERFLEAIAHMPECGGIALGMDRLAMLFCGTELIRDVMAFPDDEA